MTDEEPEKWKASRITAYTKTKSSWRVHCWSELAGVCNVKSKSVKKSLPIDMGRSAFSEIKKSYQTYNIKRTFQLFLRSVRFSFRRIFTYFQKENFEVVRVCVCNVKIINCMQRNYTVSQSEFSKLNKVLNYKFKGCIWFPTDVYIYIPGKLSIHHLNL